MYLYYVKPFQSRKHNWMEIINELGICIYVKIVMCLCNSVYTTEQRNIIAWTLILVICLVLTSNAYILMKEILSEYIYGTFVYVKNYYKNWVFKGAK